MLKPTVIHKNNTANHNVNKKTNNAHKQPVHKLPKTTIPSHGAHMGTKSKTAQVHPTGVWKLTK